MVRCRSLSQRLESTLYDLLSEGSPVARNPRLMFWEGL